MKKLKKWKLVKSKPVFESKWMSIFNNTYKLPDGKVVENYLHLKRPDYVLIIAKDKYGNILLERNYRRGVDDFVYELPAGWIDKGESSSEAAVRELKEETGYGGEVSEVWEVYPQPAFSSM